MPDFLEYNKLEVKLEEGETNLYDISHHQDLLNTKTTLEYLIIVISKNFKIMPRKTVFLLQKNKTYLAHILAKGLKDKYEPVMDYLGNILATVKHFSELIHKEILSGQLEGGFIDIMECLKPALKGKNHKAAILAAKIIAQLGKIYKNIIEINQSTRLE